MKLLAILFPLFIAASAAPAPKSSETVELSGGQLKPLIDVLQTHGVGNSFVVDQSITCAVSYSLVLSTTGPPYTIDLATLDLTNCSYTNP